MKKNEKLYILIPTFILVIVLGLLDYYTGFEISFSIFYLIPVGIMSLRKDSNKFDLIGIACFSALVWFIADESDTHKYSSIFIPYWNATVRFIFFLSISFLINKIIKIDQKRLLAANEELLKLNEEKNTILGIAAHDLRNAIGHISSFSSLLLDSKRNNKSFLDDDKDSIEIIHNSSLNALQLLGKLLDFTKIESGKVNIKIEENDYIKFVKGKIKIHQLLASKKNIIIELETEFENLIIEFDAIYLIEVISNLITNAIKYSYENRKIVIRITKSNDYVLTEVIDSGVGIPENELNELFQPFQKASSKPTGNETSTGLGLAIVKKIINLHNGTFGVKSKLHEGSNFYYYLPINYLSSNIKNEQ